MEYRVIIPAAGQGKRMQAGKNKQFILLDEKPVIVHTLSTFQQDQNCKEIVLVVSEKEKENFRMLVEEFQLSKVTQLVTGGSERQESVFNGLKALPQEGIVLVHDGARPFVTIDMITRVAKEAAAHDAAVLAVPIKDTLKRSDGSVIIETVDRSHLWAVQTPQAFRYTLLYEAYERAVQMNFTATDDASLVEALGRNVAIVVGDETNVKLTTPADLQFADVILEWKKGTT